MNTPNIIEHLKTRFQQKRSAHPSFKLMKIDNSLFPNGIIIPFETEAKDSDNKLRTVKDIVAESWKKGEKNHLMIQGEGGIGKTVTLLSLPVMFDDYTAPAIYIPLHELKGGGTDDMIESYIKKRVLDDDEELFRQLKKLRKTEWENGPSLLLLLDGFNEIPIELRGAISENIEQWSEYSGIQLITSSRFDIHQYVYLRSNFSKIELQPLSEDTVLKYLEDNGIDTPKNSTITKLITIPLLLTLYIKTETIRREQPAPSAKFLETRNAGTLIWNYLQSELRRFRNPDLREEAKACVLAMELIAPYIAWTMQKQSELILDESVFLDRIDEAYGLMETHYANKDKFPPHIKTTLQKSKGLPDNEHIRSLLEEQLCLFINNEGHYRLMHQQFRDALAAMHLINSIYLNGDSRPMEWNSTVDYYVMQFVADLIDEKEANRLWEQNRTSAQLEPATRNQLELQRRLHDCDFSKLDFSNLDLSNISMYPYRVGNTMLKLPTDADAMNEVKISEKTFIAEGHQGWIRAVAVTPNGKYAVSGSDDCTIRIWSLETGKLVRTLEGHNNWVRAVAVMPNNKYVVSGSYDHTIRVWNLETGELIRVLKGHEDGINALAVTQNGKYVVSGSWDCTIRIWDMETGNLTRVLKGHKRRVNTVTVTLNGKYIVSGSNDRTIRFWNLETGKLEKTLEGLKEEVTAVTVTPNGKHIVSGLHDCTIRIWNMETCELEKTLEGRGGWVHDVSVTPSGKYAISAFTDNTIQIWNLETGEPIKTIEGHKDEVTAVAVTPNGKYLVSGSDDQTIRIWDLETGIINRTIEGHKDSVNTVTVTPNGKYIVNGSSDRSIRIWDMETCELIKTLEGHKDSVKAVAITPNGNYAVSVSGDNIICIWNLETSELTMVLKEHLASVNAVGITPNGKYVISGSNDRSIRIWDLETGKLTRSLEGHRASINSIAVTPNGKHIISGSDDRTISIWDLETGELVRTLNNYEQGWVSAVAVTPNGKHIVSGSSDQNIRIWDLETGKLTRTLKGHVSLITTIAITPNGKQLVSGSRDCTIRIWNLKTGELTKTLEDYKARVNTVAITPDGKHIVSGVDDGTIRIINIATYKFQDIHILPLSLVGFNFSKAIMSNKLIETLRQNGAIV